MRAPSPRPVTSSVRLPVYKKLAFSVTTIDNFLNNPQIGYKKNSFQFTTGFALNLQAHSTEAK